MSNSDFLAALEPLQAQLVITQQWLMETGQKVLIIFEGRDAAGKDGTIKRMTEHMSARNTRAVALPKPSDREKSQWYFQRYVAHLPAAGEVVIFNRSWYNRGGVEPVMGFCSPEENEEFLREVVPFEAMLSNSGIKVIKLWLDISRKRIGLPTTTLPSGNARANIGQIKEVKLLIGDSVRSNRAPMLDVVIALLIDNALINPTAET